MFFYLSKGRNRHCYFTITPKLVRDNLFPKVIQHILKQGLLKGLKLGFRAKNICASLFRKGTAKNFFYDQCRFAHF